MTFAESTEVSVLAVVEFPATLYDATWSLGCRGKALSFWRKGAGAPSLAHSPGSNRRPVVVRCGL